MLDSSSNTAKKQVYDVTTDDIEKLLSQEQRDQKRTGSGIRGRASRTGRVSSMRMPSDLLSKKDKRDYRKAGKVVAYNMYEKMDVVTKDDFLRFDPAKQKDCLVKWREKHSDRQIREHFDFTIHGFYKLLDSFGLEKKGKPEPKSTGKVKEKVVGDKGKVSDAEHEHTLPLVNSELVGVEQSVNDVSDSNQQVQVGSFISTNTKAPSLPGSDSVVVMSHGVTVDRDTFGFAGEFDGRAVLLQLLTLTSTMDVGKRYLVSVNIEEVKG